MYMLKPSFNIRNTSSSINLYYKIVNSTIFIKKEFSNTIIYYVIYTNIEKPLFAQQKSVVRLKKPERIYLIAV